eukprot:gene10186-2344_t
MSTVEKLLISGVRSYSPDGNHHQVIEFLHPMTVILGANGCGKTTIIECLKYMTTGDYPPNSKGGFVHDPKVAAESTVNAIMKLCFTSITGKPMVATKSLQATMSARSTNPSLKNLEGSLVILDPETGEIVINLGVSKHVLSHVIFCHQEDALWPLGEPSKLKTKFDEIFSSTRYTKALDTIKKLRQEKKSVIILLEKDVSHLQETARHAKETRKDQQEMQKEAECIRAEIADKTEILNHIENQLEELNNFVEGNQSRRDKLIELETQLKGRLQRQKEDYEELSPYLEETIHALKKKKQHNSTALRGKQKRIIELQKDADKTLKKKRELDQKLIHFKTQRATLEANMQVGNTEEIDSKSFRSFLQKKLEQVEKRKKKEKSQFKSEQKRIDAKHEKKQAEFAETRTELQMIGKKSEECRSSIAHLETQISKIKDSEESLHHISVALESAKRKASSAAKSLDAFEEKTQNENIVEQIDEIDREMKEARMQIHLIRQDTETNNRIQALQQAVSSAEKAIETSMKNHGEQFEAVLAERMAPHKYEAALKEKLKSNNRDKTQAISTRDGLVHHLADKYAHQSSRQLELSSLRERNEAWQTRLFAEVGNQPLSAELSRTNEELRRLRSQQDLRPAMQKVYKIIKRKSQEQHACFVCQRGFTSIDETEACLQMIQSKIEKFSLDDSEDKQKTDILQQRLEKLQRLELESQRHEEENKRIVELEGELAALDHAIEELESQKDKAMYRLEDIQENIQQASALLQVANSITSSHKLVDDNRNQIQALQKKLKAAHLGTIENAENSERELQSKREKLMTLHYQLKDEHSELQQHKSDAEQAVLRQEEAYFREQQLQAEKSKLLDQLSANRKDLASSTQNYKEMQPKLEEKRKEMEAADRARRDFLHKQQQVIDDTQNEISKLERSIDRLKSIESDIQRCEKMNYKSKLEQCNIDFSACEQEIEETSCQYNDLTTHTRQLSADISTYEQQKHNLEANIKYKEDKAGVDKLKQEIAQLKEDLKIESANENLESLEEVTAKKNCLLKEKHYLEGRLQSLQASIQKCVQKLQSSPLYGIDDRLKTTRIKHDANKKIHSDLEKYYSALDKAIASFHEIKMASVNRIVKELWQKTYQGNDIDFIEVTSELEKKQQESIRGKGYQYRVVMVKGDTRLDMRGRCSAGQKVMASIIIRLALADCFCANCGIIALDEPTTNLDEDNKKALATCLAE